jgi:hypothetical protein
MCVSQDTERGARRWDYARGPFRIFEVGLHLHKLPQLRIILTRRSVWVRGSSPSQRSIAITTVPLILMLPVVNCV